ncbi:signal peptidase I [Oscillatoria sp. FACHB-1406]|uniref:signal peptidase I n=1 Tax=Oscillatoria sp. FACHB-1406 TaxID=2692846 RepID=UPI00168944DF|nr:signal peptidase I [Oscillatoria sp. FACHB-1406]MBD2579654.1 signal peptidase I [Oscillatoria sp. FACHB-1406]
MTSKEKPAVTPTETEKTSSELTFWEQVKSNSKTIAIALLIALIIRAFIAEPRYIPSDSMLPTLEVSDRVIVEKISYRFHPPQRGDIIVFEPPPQLQALGYQADQAFIKRTIGEPHQTVEVRDRTVYLDNLALKEDYIAEAPNYDLQRVTIPDNTIWVMGDNRNNSNDSHIWGFLPQRNVIGRAFFRFWPLNRLGWISRGNENANNPIELT